MGADPVQPAALVQIQAVRTALNASLAEGVEAYLESFDGFRFEGDDQSNEYLALLKKKYSRHPVDLVIVLGNPAAEFAFMYHSQIWPNVPVMLSSVPEDWLRTRPAPEGFFRVPYRIDVQKTLSLAAALQPGARRLVIIGGATDVDRRLTALVADSARHEEARWTSIDAWEGVPVAELQERLAALDSQTVVVYTTMYRDRNGRRYFPYEVVAPMVQASGAPIYGWYSVYLQYGLTGGAVYDLEENGRRTGQAAASVLRHDLSGAADLSPLPARCMINVAEAERLRLDTSGLPADCRRVNLPRSIYREYRGTMLALGGVLVAQFLTIAALLAQRRRRRHAEAEASARGTELARAARISTVGELSASIAHEVGQPLGAILSNADAADLLVKSGAADVDEIQEILADVRRDALRANDVVMRLRALLQKQSVAFRPVSLNTALESALLLIEPEARRRRIRIDMMSEPEVMPVLGDEVQLQQIVLNLAINAMDAMSDCASERRILSMSTHNAANGVELTVADRGTGFDASTSQRLFEPFYTRKSNGMGLGLSIVRSIVRAHGGDIHAAAQNGEGAIFTVWLPALRARSTEDEVQARYADADADAGGRQCRPSAIAPRGNRIAPDPDGAD